MNYIENESLVSANKSAIYCLYSSLQNRISASVGNTFVEIIDKIKSLSKGFSEAESKTLFILNNGIKTFSLEKSVLISQIKYKNGMSASAFRDANGKIIFVFAPTGKGEWIDNGEGLSGVPEQNTYLSFDNNGRILKRTINYTDFATDQQVRALNWFNRICKMNNLNKRSEIIVTGHSKGGNNAQFVTIKSPLVSECFSFDGQGFSPEALNEFRNKNPINYELQRQKILSLCANDDYVNVLGKQITLTDNIYYFITNEINVINNHKLYAILNSDGKFTKQTEQGEISKFMQSVSDDLMNLNPAVRKYATLGVMNLFQKYVGKGKPVNNDTVSINETLAGIGLSLGLFLNKF